MAIIVLKHAPSDGLGRLAPILRGHAHTFEVRRLWAGQSVPVDFDDTDAVISLGGPMNVGDSVPWMQAELAYLREAHTRQLPLLGICLGHQMIAAALGGEVGPADRPEFGFCPVNLNPSGQTDIILAGIPWTTHQFQTHSQEVKKLPEGAALLASSPACKVQCYRVGLRTYGFQYHFEVTTADMEGFLADAGCARVMQQLSLSTADVRKQAAAHADMFERAGQRLAGNIAQFMFPILARTK